MKKSLFLAILLASAGSMAALLQPTVPAPGGESACRISTGLLYNIGKTKDELRMVDLKGGVNFTHYTAYDFFYGVGFVFGGEAVKGMFTEAGKKDTDLVMNLELSAGFMPELAERVHAGIVTSVGYGRMFNSTKNELAKAAGVTFGTLNFKVGLGLSFGFTDTFALYLTPSYTMSSILFLSDTATYPKDEKNLSGMEVPVGLMFGLIDQVSMFVETTTKVLNFAQVKESYRQQFTLGVSYTM